MTRRTLLTFCPPAPPDRAAEISMSCERMRIISIREIWPLSFVKYQGRGGYILVDLDIHFLCLWHYGHCRRGRVHAAL